MKKKITILGLPASVIRLANALPQGVNRMLTMAGMYSALRNLLSPRF